MPKKKTLSEISDVLDIKLKEKLDELQRFGVIDKDPEGRLIVLLPTPKTDRDRVMVATGKFLAIKYITDLINGK